MRRSPGQPSVNAVSTVPSVRPTASRLRRIRPARSVSVFATAPKTCRPPLAKDAKLSIDRIRAVMHHFRGKPGSRRSIAPSRKLWTALRALDGYLVGQSDRLIDYGERHRAGLRVGTALTEGTANFLVNRRMNKSQQMRWSR